MKRALHSTVAVAIAAVCAAGCTKRTSETASDDVVEPDPDVTDDAKQTPEELPEGPNIPDDLWELAPPGTKSGVVAVDGAIARVQSAADVVQRSLATNPGGSALWASVTEWLEGELPTNLDTNALGAGPAASFATAAGNVYVVPYSDEHALGAALTKVGRNTCRKSTGYLVCSESRAALDAVGTSDVIAKRIAAWKGAQPGDLTVYFAPGGLPPVASASLQGTEGALITADLEPGAVALHIHLSGTPSEGMRRAVAAKSSPLVAELASDAPAGFVVFHLGELFTDWKAGLATMPAGSALRGFLASLRGDVVGYTHPGSSGGVIEIGLDDPAAARRWISACEATGATGLPFTLTRAGNRCQLTASGAAGPAHASLRVDGNTLVAQFKGDDSGSTTASAAASANTFRDGSWQLAMWGRAFNEHPGPAMPGPPGSAVAGLISWAVAYVNELGIGVRVADDGLHVVFDVRTMWSNPDDVLASLEPLVADLARGNTTAVAKIRALAEHHPDSRLASDLANGEAGMLPASSAIGIIAGIAVPAFQKYRALAAQQGRQRIR